MHSLMRRTVVATCTATALLGPAVGMASASGPSVLHWVQSRRASAAAPRAAGWTAVPLPSTGARSNVLSGVAVVSATSAWAVGNYSNGTINQARALIVHWNGSSWKQQSSPNPGSAFNTLNGVAATSSANAWAVGYYNNGASTPDQTLILHWNGAAWKQVPSPNPAAKDNNVLSGVAATSATNAWAVGTNCGGCSGGGQAPGALTVHWNGTAWKQQSSPSPGGSSFSQLDGVAATSATNAWAVGGYNKGATSHTLILHCC